MTNPLTTAVWAPIGDVAMCDGAAGVVEREVGVQDQGDCV
jgi:hypothetical protein